MATHLLPDVRSFLPVTMDPSQVRPKRTQGSNSELRSGALRRSAGVWRGAGEPHHEGWVPGRPASEELWGGQEVQLVVSGTLFIW